MKGLFCFTQFWTMFGWPNVFEPVLRQNIKVGVRGRGSCSPHCGQEAKGERGRDQGPNIPFKVMPYD
jgi:hypothetical protein